MYKLTNKKEQNMADTSKKSTNGKSKKVKDLSLGRGKSGKVRGGGGAEAPLHVCPTEGMYEPKSCNPTSPPSPPPPKEASPS